ncbi:hypothetical protein NDU88_001099 [Pleurodeles waltl]|uniref:Uncharacterized protein n=1 Tax=Pleurodeles waltl TaxID=8319 RepID=A0AAV7P6Z2_PLEWA|nr:hypothetical protein NDU88_001099 [Pleurodeles waltl]
MSRTHIRFEPSKISWASTHFKDSPGLRVGHFSAKELAQKHKHLLHVTPDHHLCEEGSGEEMAPEESEYQLRIDHAGAAGRMQRSSLLEVGQEGSQRQSACRYSKYDEFHLEIHLQSAGKDRRHYAATDRLQAPRPPKMDVY